MRTQRSGVFGLSVWVLVLSVAGCAAPVVSSVSDFHNTLPALSKDAEVAVWFPKGLVADSVSAPVFVGRVPGEHVWGGGIGVAGPGKQVSDLVEEARRAARKLGCNGLVFGPDDFQVTVKGYMHAGATAILQKDGFVALSVDSLPVVSVSSWRETFDQLSLKGPGSGPSSQELIERMTTLDKLAEKKAFVLDSGDAEVILRAVLFRAYVSGKVESMDDRRFVSKLAAGLPFDYPHSAVQESWRNLNEALAAVELPDGGVLQP